MRQLEQCAWYRAGPRPCAFVIGVLLCTAVSHQARAQDIAPIAETARVASRLGDLYAQMQRDNPKLVAAQALVRAAQARVPGARRPPDPQLQLGFMNYELPRLRPMEQIGMTQLQLMQMVPLGGKLALAGRVAGAQASVIDERGRELVWELRRQTAMAFYDLYATDRQLDVTRETLRLLQDIARTAEAMYRVGEGRQADVLRSHVEIARMTGDTMRMQAMRLSMVARLNALRNTDAALSITTPGLPQFPDVIPARSWLDSLAAISRPMIRAGLDGVRAAEASASLARREIVPDLQVGVQYGQRSATMTRADATGVLMASRTTERMGSLMLGATIPIFARDRQFQMRNEANAMKAMAEAEVAAMRADTRGGIGEAYASLERSRSLSRLYRTTVLPQAEATVSSAMSAYRVGTVNFMTLLDSRMTVNTYRQQLYVLEADEGKAWAELEMLIGRELIDSDSISLTAAITPARELKATRGTR
ncbi:MAG: TolC family protein [Gemmatimonadaceae bacterium]